MKRPVLAAASLWCWWRKWDERRLTLGYAVAAADTILAPFTPSSNTARSGGTIYPVIKNLPPLYDSNPDDPSMRRVGSAHHAGGHRHHLRDQYALFDRSRA